MKFKFGHHKFKWHVYMYPRLRTTDVDHIDDFLI